MMGLGKVGKVTELILEFTVGKKKKKHRNHRIGQTDFGCDDQI